MTRLQLQTSQQARPYSGFNDVVGTILREEGWKALYKGLVLRLFLFRPFPLLFDVVLFLVIKLSSDPEATWMDGWTLLIDGSGMLEITLLLVWRSRQCKYSYLSIWRLILEQFFFVSIS